MNPMKISKNDFLALNPSVEIFEITGKDDQVVAWAAVKYDFFEDEGYFVMPQSVKIVDLEGKSLGFSDINEESGQISIEYYLKDEVATEQLPVSMFETTGELMSWMMSFQEENG